VVLDWPQKRVFRGLLRPPRSGYFTHLHHQIAHILLVALFFLNYGRHKNRVVSMLQFKMVFHPLNRQSRVNEWGSLWNRMRLMEWGKFVRYVGLSPFACFPASPNLFLFWLITARSRSTGLGRLSCKTWNHPVRDRQDRTWCMYRAPVIPFTSWLSVLLSTLSSTSRFTCWLVYFFPNP
jgi:hypothetical protein